MHARHGKGNLQLHRQKDPEDTGREATADGKVPRLILMIITDTDGPTVIKSFLIVKERRHAGGELLLFGDLWGLYNGNSSSATTAVGLYINNTGCMLSA